MTVHVLMPIFNRLAMTRSMLECLREQRADEPLAIVVVDDGSTDGTAEFLRTQTDITVLQGDGSLWWGGAIDLGLRHVFTLATEQDWILLVNNDTRIDSDFVQSLLDAARLHAPAAVGSVIRGTEPPHRLLSIGPYIDSWRFLVRDAMDDPACNAGAETVPVDALSGRGVLYSVSALRRVGGMRVHWLPHYLADYEVSLRVRKHGWRLLVSTAAAVYSDDDYGNMRRAQSWRDKLLSVRSPFYLPALLVFWWEASNWLQRLTVPLRLPLLILFPRLRKPLP